MDKNPNESLSEYKNRIIQQYLLGNAPEDFNYREYVDKAKKESGEQDEDDIPDYLEKRAAENAAQEQQNYQEYQQALTKHKQQLGDLNNQRVNMLGNLSFDQRKQARIARYKYFRDNIEDVNKDEAIRLQAQNQLDEEEMQRDADLQGIDAEDIQSGDDYD